MNILIQVPLLPLGKKESRTISKWPVLDKNLFSLFIN